MCQRELNVRCGHHHNKSCKEPEDPRICQSWPINSTPPQQIIILRDCTAKPTGAGWPVGAGEEAANVCVFVCVCVCVREMDRRREKARERERQRERVKDRETDNELLL